jgi:hypothetical protein
MNQKILLAAIVAVVAAAVVIGLWISGAWQAGPLAGSIGDTCVPTTITSDCYHGMFRTVVWGTLKTSSGTPLPNQHLLLLQADRYDDSGNPVAWEAWKETDTGSDGKFGKVEGEALYYRPIVVYNGGSYNGVSYCNTSVICHGVGSIPIEW